jgi:hypothetical protein
MSDALLEAIHTRDVDRVAPFLPQARIRMKIGKSRYSECNGREFPLQVAIGVLEALRSGQYPGRSQAGPIDAVVLLLRYGARVKGWDVNNGGGSALCLPCSITKSKRCGSCSLMAQIPTCATMRVTRRSVWLCRERLSGDGSAAPPLRGEQNHA